MAYTAYDVIHEHIATTNLATPCGTESHTYELHAQRYVLGDHLDHSHDICTASVCMCLENHEMYMRCSRENNSIKAVTQDMYHSRECGHCDWMLLIKDAILFTCTQKDITYHCITGSLQSQF